MSTLADVILPTHCACGQLLERTDDLERHVEQGCWRAPSSHDSNCEYCGGRGWVKLYRYEEMKYGGLDVTTKRQRCSKCWKESNAA